MIYWTKQIKQNGTKLKTRRVASKGDNKQCLKRKCPVNFAYRSYQGLVF